MEGKRFLEPGNISPPERDQRQPPRDAQSRPNENAWGEIDSGIFEVSVASQIRDLGIEMPILN